MQTAHTQRGFTILEFLLYIFLASFLLTALYTLYTTSQNLQAKQQVVAEVEEQGQHIMQTITQTVRNATGVTTPTAGVTGASLSVPTYTAGTSPTVFTLTSGAVTIQEGVGGAVALSSSKVTVSSLQFTNLTRSGTDGTVRISFTVTYTNPSGREPTTYSKSFAGSATVRGVFP